MWKILREGLWLFQGLRLLQSLEFEMWRRFDKKQKSKSYFLCHCVWLYGLPWPWIFLYLNLKKRPIFLTKLIMQGICNKFIETQVGSPAVRLRLARCTAWVKRWSEAMDFFQTIFKTNISLLGIFENYIIKG